MTHALVGTVIALIAAALLTAMSLRANRRFKTVPRLPMQWWLDGSVTWTAARKVALAFIPVLAAVCLAAMVAMTASVRPRVGQEDLVIPANILIAFVFIGGHALHLWLVQRTLQRQR